MPDAGYIDKLNELDTEGVEAHEPLFPVTNVFREDEVTNTDNQDKILKNAPGEKKGCSKYRVRWNSPEERAVL